jgi:hypothetical protein
LTILRKQYRIKIHKEGNMSFINKIKLVVIVLSVCSCTNKNTIQIDTSNLNVSEQIMDVPEMPIQYGGGLDVPGLIILVDFIKPGTSGWSYFNGNDIINFVMDSKHPLDSSNNLPKIEKTKKIKISFSNPPSYYTVRYWTENYIGDASAYEMYFQIMDVKDDTINLPNEELGYIFEVKAVWESVNGIKNIQGYANYAFFVLGNIIKE